MAQGWALLERVVSLTFIAVFIGIVVVGLIAYQAVNKAFARVDRLIDSVKTATNKSLDSVTDTMKSAKGVFQDVQHTVGSLVAIVKGIAGRRDGARVATDSDIGLYRVVDGYDLVKEDTDKISHSVSSGTFAGAHIHANFTDGTHSLFSTLNNHPVIVVGADADGNEVRMVFKLTSLNSCLLTAETNVGTSESARTVTFDAFQVAGTDLEFVSGELANGQLQVLLDETHSRAELSWSTLF